MPGEDAAAVAAQGLRVPSSAMRVSAGTSGDLDMTNAAAPRRTPRHTPDARGACRALAAIVALLALTIGIVPSASAAHADERTRVDFYDPQGRRTGYAIMERRTGRIDYYDTMGRRTGYGRVDPTGKVEKFRPDGKREGQTAVPVPPKAGRR
jgi:hypothetical protein